MGQKFKKRDLRNALLEVENKAKPLTDWPSSKEQIFFIILPKLKPLCLFSYMCMRRPHLSTSCLALHGCAIYSHALGSNVVFSFLTKSPLVSPLHDNTAYAPQCTTINSFCHGISRFLLGL